jgi:hypothetical protein
MGFPEIAIFLFQRKRNLASFAKFRFLGDGSLGLQSEDPVQFTQRKEKLTD